MRPGQERIYYIVAETLDAARASPHLELLRQKGVEVLLMGDRIDEWVMGQVSEFEGKRFKDVSRGDLELGGLADQAERARIDEERKEHKALLKRFKDALGRQGAGSAGQRAPARFAQRAWCTARAKCRPQMRRLLAANGQTMPASKPVLELNVTHPLVRHMDGLKDGEAFEELALAAVRPGGADRRRPGRQPGRISAAG